MAVNIVSVSETCKPQIVSKPDLSSDGHCQILPFMKYDREMGYLLRSLRTARGFTVEKGADLLAMEKGTLSKKERGLLPFDDQDLRMAARVYQIERWKLVALAAGVPQEKLDFADVYDHISPNTRADLLRMVRVEPGKAGSS